MDGRILQYICSFCLKAGTRNLFVGGGGGVRKIFFLAPVPPPRIYFFKV